MWERRVLSDIFFSSIDRDDIKVTSRESFEDQVICAVVWAHFLLQQLVLGSVD